MKTTTLRIVLIVLVAALALSMAGCKGESSPTAPPPTTTTTPPGGVTPPTGATIVFPTEPAKPVPPNTTPTITSVCVQTGSTCTTPATGIPAGGQTVVITGTNFRAPVRVLFDPGNGQPAKEAFVSSVTATQIVVVAPPFDIITGQTLPVSITVITEAGTATEQKVT